MPLPTLLLATIETAINRLLALDPASRARGEHLAGKRVQIQLREFTPPLWLLFSPGRVDCLGQYEGQADASLTLSLAALPLLKDPGLLTRYIREEKLDISGDPGLINAVAVLFGRLEIDWEEQLSHYTGDVLAHGLCRGLRQLHQGASRQLELLRQDLAEYITEEARLAPGPLEVAAFCDDVDALRRRFEQTQLRVERLLHRVAP